MQLNSYLLNVRVVGNRIERRSQVQWTNWKHRKSVEIYLHCITRNIFVCNVYNCFDCDRNELFRLWFGKWILFFAIAIIVSWLKRRKNSWINHFANHSLLYFRNTPSRTVPLNWKTPFGFLIAGLFEYMCGVSMCEFFSISFSFLIGSCVLVKAFLNDVAGDLGSLHVNKEILPNGNEAKKIEKIFCEISCDHSTLKQLSTNSTGLY